MPLQTRREFIKILAAQSALLPFLKVAPLSAAPKKPHISNQFIICAKNQTGQYLATKITDQGQITELFTLESRGHGSAKSINGDIAIFARRPNNQLYLINPKGQVTICYANDGRHFSGHGTFSNDGKLLYTSENAYDQQDPNKTGMIGIWDVKHAKRIGEFLSGGIGNHQIMLMPNNNILAIANGGILTHPDHPRQKLNLSDMRPNISFINVISGHIINKVNLPNALHQLSIRHLDISNNHNLCIAMQYQGSKAQQVPLLATIMKGETLKFAKTPVKILQQYKHYIGSIMWDNSGQYFAATSPRGNIASFYNANGEYINSVILADICAIAPTQTAAEFILTGGNGDIATYNIVTKQRLERTQNGSNIPQYNWDNHMLML